ncbi:MAG TPA: K(+)-transporting ATPase subunit F [Bacteroidales bacterium]|nr:K(+)-transporting ATPase subunit F [Bacteroidales bacterium]
MNILLSIGTGMNSNNYLEVALVAILLLGYLVFVLLKPEKF